MYNVHGENEKAKCAACGKDLNERSFAGANQGLVACAEKVIENHHNCKLFVDATKVNLIKPLSVNDLKMNNSLCEMYLKQLYIPMYTWRMYS